MCINRVSLFILFFAWLARPSGAENYLLKTIDELTISLDPNTALVKGIKLQTVEIIDPESIVGWVFCA